LLLQDIDSLPEKTKKFYDGLKKLQFEGLDNPEFKKAEEFTSLFHWEFCVSYG
jgi:hypothetical protein